MKGTKKAISNYKAMTRGGPDAEYLVGDESYSEWDLTDAQYETLINEALTTAWENKRDAEEDGDTKRAYQFEQDFKGLMSRNPIS